MVFILDRLRITLKMGKDWWYLKNWYFRVIFRIMKKFMDAKRILMGYLKENLWKEFERGMESSIGTMVKLFKVNGKAARKMDLVFGNHKKVIIMKGNGERIDSMEKEYIDIS